jgi:RNA polymerase sigma factor for flagellar operon FliA
VKQAADTSGIDLVLVPPRVEASLWRRLRFESDAACRALLFDRYTALARALSGRQMRVRSGTSLERGDVEQFAYEGLLQAIDRFDPLQGTPFGAFARRRILGAISDGVARLSELGAQLGFRRRTEAERARSLARAPQDAATGALRELSELAAGLAIGLMLEGTGMIEAEGGVDVKPSAYDSLAWREMQSLLVRAIAELPEREALIIRQHYESGVSFTQIAHLLGISKGRVSQLHKAALQRLGDRIASSE